MSCWPRAQAFAWVRVREHDYDYFYYLLIIPPEHSLSAFSTGISEKLKIKGPRHRRNKDMGSNLGTP